MKSVLKDTFLFGEGNPMSPEEGWYHNWHPENFQPEKNAVMLIHDIFEHNRSVDLIPGVKGLHEGELAAHAAMMYYAFSLNADRRTVDHMHLTDMGVLEGAHNQIIEALEDKNHISYDPSWGDQFLYKGDDDVFEWMLEELLERTPSMYHPNVESLIRAGYGFAERLLPNTWHNRNVFNQTYYVLKDMAEFTMEEEHYDVKMTYNISGPRNKRKMTLKFWNWQSQYYINVLKDDFDLERHINKFQLMTY